MTKVLENTDIKSATRVVKSATAFDLLAAIGKTIEAEKRAKDTKRVSSDKRCQYSVALCAINMNGAKHNNLTVDVALAIDQAVEAGTITKRVVTEINKVVKSAHVIDAITKSDGNPKAAFDNVIKPAMGRKQDQLISWGGMQQFADNGEPVAPIDPADAMIEAWLKMEPESAEKVLSFFKAQIK